MDLTNDEKWHLKALSDADFAGDKDTRISVTGYIVYFKGIPVCWRSKSQQGVTLLTTEAEYVACSEVINEIVFISQLLHHLRIDVECPVKVHVDKIGAIFLAENLITSDRTKHVDIRFHFIRQHIQERTVKVEFVKSRENYADLFTKHVNGETFEEHRRKMVWTQAEYEWAVQESTTGRVIEDVVHFPKKTSPYLTKVTSPCLL